MKKYATLTLLGAMAAMALPTEAAVLAQYVTGSDPTDSPISDVAFAPGVFVGSLSVVGLSGGTGGPVRENFGGAPMPGSGGSWLAVNGATANGAGGGAPAIAANADNLYLGITMSALTPGTLNLTSLTFLWGWAVDTTGAFQDAYQVFVSVNGGGFSQLGSQVLSGSVTPADADSSGSFASQTVDLSSLTGLTDVAIRLVPTDNTNSPSRIQVFQNVTVNGAIVPEPSVALLGGMGALALLRRRRND